MSCHPKVVEKITQVTDILLAQHRTVMWLVHGTCHTIEHIGHARSMCGLELRSQSSEQGFDVTPVNIATDLSFEYHFERVFLFVIHRIRRVVELCAIALQSTLSLYVIRSLCYPT